MSHPTLPLLAAVAALTLAGCAQTPSSSTTQGPDRRASGAQGHHHRHHHAPHAGPTGKPTPEMERHMRAMHEMHEKMARARTPEEREALRAEHGRLMEQCMGMMGSMHPGRAPGRL